MILGVTNLCADIAGAVEAHEATYAPTPPIPAIREQATVT